jgi:hypothetical protein
MQARKTAPQFMQPELEKSTQVGDRAVLTSLGRLLQADVSFFLRGLACGGFTPLQERQSQN